jgi:hypothetical protein
MNHAKLVVGILLITSQLLGQRLSAQRLDIRLVNGTVSYTEMGQRHSIALGKKAADLWVAPDESIVAFIGIDKFDPPSSIVRSTLYVAKRADQFKPILIDVNSALETMRRGYGVIRQPSVSPDMKTLYFALPEYATSWTLMSVALTVSVSHIQQVQDLLRDYCVAWGGVHTGEMLMILRHNPPLTGLEGVTYPCYLRTKSGRLEEVAAESACFASFPEWATKWLREHGGGSCPYGPATDTMR